jgi:hypothetical protein
MKARILSLIGALALCLMAITGVGTAQAACPANFCAQAQQECLSGCPCAMFTCNPTSCWSDCVCPIFC